MPFCTKKPFNFYWLIVIISFLFCQTTLAQNSTVAGIHIEKVGFGTSGSEIQFVRSIHISPSLEKILDTGVPLFISDVIEVHKPRWYWTNKKIFSQKRTWVIYKHSLTEQWLVIDAHNVVEPVPSLAKAIAKVVDTNTWKLEPTFASIKKADYYVRVRSYIDTDLMSPTLFLDTINNNDWFLDSDWINIPSSGRFVSESSGSKL